MTGIAVKVKTGEPEEDAALREVDEETGLRGRLGPENGANRHAWGPAP
jgi:8-oxo-dGTP pyrophosphatase MutT (NUDIX family)